MRNISSISLHHPNGLPKHWNKVRNDIGVDKTRVIFIDIKYSFLPIRAFS